MMASLVGQAQGQVLDAGARSPGQQAHSQGGWLREMELAQAQAWFPGPLDASQQHPARGEGRPAVHDAGDPAGLRASTRRQQDDPAAQRGIHRSNSAHEPSAPAQDAHAATRPTMAASGDGRSGTGALQAGLAEVRPPAAGQPIPSMGSLPRAAPSLIGRPAAVEGSVVGPMNAANKVAGITSGPWVGMPSPVPAQPAVRVAEASRPGVRAAAADPTPPAEHPQAPVRIHVEPRRDGLHVWIGLDGDAASRAAQLPALVTALRRQADGGGHRLASVTCNGEVVYALTTGNESAGAPAPVINRSSHGL